MMGDGVGNGRDVGKIPRGVGAIVGLSIVVTVVGEVVGSEKKGEVGVFVSVEGVGKVSIMIGGGVGVGVFVEAGQNVGSACSTSF